MKILLFIENFEIELNEGVQFLLNKQFEDLSNPTEIINDWSKTVEIPFTKANNRIFGYIYNPSRVIVSDGTETSYKQMNIYFDPTKKLDFRLVYNSFVLIEGYAKMNNIKMVGNKGTYNITLYGTLGKIFQEMKKITFDLTSENSDYIIDCSQYWTSTISAQNVASSCNTSFKRTHNLTNNWQNYIGYALNNSFDEDFDYTCFQNDNNARKFIDELKEVDFYGKTGVQPEQVLENGGLLPRSFGEFRSYLQIPYMYMEKLWLIFLTKAEEITGYTFDLDPEWFNISNPYWWNLCIILMRKDVNRGISYNNKYTDLRNYTNNTGENQSLGGWTATGGTSVMSGDLHITTVVSEEMPILVHPSVRENKLVFGDNKVFAVDLQFNSYLMAITQDLHLNDSNGLVLELTAKGESGASQTQRFFFRHKDGGVTYTDATYIDVPDSATSSYYIILPTAEAYFNCIKNIFGEYVTFSWKAFWKNDNYPFSRPSIQGLFQYYLGSAPMDGQPIGTNSYMNIKVLDEKWARSGGSFTINDLWNKDYNLFDLILTYCKVFDLKWIVDSFNKKIYIKSRKNYFANYTITDWTNKIDRSKDFVVQPVTFNNKYVLFNYVDEDNQLNKNYKDDFGINYGEYRLITDYNFNTETKKLFNKPFKPSIIYSDTLLNYLTLQLGIINYITQRELFIFNRDKDKNFKDIFGSYFFYTGKDRILTPGLSLCAITDDTVIQVVNAIYYYAGRNVQDVYEISRYNCLSSVYEDKLCLFNKPKKNYTYNYSIFNNTYSIYDLYWKNYLDERYNIQNKIVTCYLTITPKDWIDFQFNKFITIDGVLYMVNKIYDYNIETIEPTKVDLITITDINGYTE